MFTNPEFLRYVRIQLTPRRALFAGSLTIILILIGYFLIWSSTEPTQYSPIDYDRWKEFGGASFKLLLFAQFVLLHVVATSATGGTMVQERMRGTIIFQQMNLLSAHETLLGKLFGSTAFCYFLAALIMPFAMISAVLGKLGPEKLVPIYLLLIVGGLCWQAVGLCASTLLANSSESAGRNLMGLSYSVGGLAGVLSLCMIGVVWNSPEWEVNVDTVYFFGLKLFPMLIVLGLMLFVGLWCYAGAVRGFKDMQLIQLSPRPIWYFFASLEALLLGLFWQGLNTSSGNYEYNHFYHRQATELVLSYLSINWMALTALAGIIAINRNQLREWWSAERDAISMLKRRELRNALSSYPIAIGISLIGLAALWFSLHARLMESNAVDYRLSYGMMMMISIVFVLTMAAMAGFIQFWSMFRFKVANRAGVALWVLFFIVAGIATSVLGQKSIPAFINPLVITDLALNEPGELGALSIALIVQVLFALGCLALAAWKWRRTRAELLKV